MRVSKGLSFYNEKSLIESIVESLHFTSNNQPDLTTVTRDDGIQGCNDDSIQIREEPNDIEMVDR